ncbi:hypothetical protein MHH81_01545 [Psychrobacillus sp. FSL H8-0484]|uniref:hypothetical protein n=1 Tax=Psychrobacillus sp. FSL H8-0484 TaxID=2921390 RepID=UPI0030FA983D
MTLIPATILKEKFHILAHFYTTNEGGNKYLMRSEAKIVRKGKEITSVDAVIVMANPGSCLAIDQTIEFDAFPKVIEEKRFIAANPDPTQYQLMNLMERMQWDYLKIINLSDVCTGNYDQFKKYLNEFKHIEFHKHSIFHESRCAELKSHLGEESILIYAWGGNSSIKQLATRVIDEKLKQKGLILNERPYYRHPKPAKIVDRAKWLTDMESQLKKRNEKVNN